MDILLGKYEIQSYHYIAENLGAQGEYKPCSIQSHLLGGGLTLLFYLVFFALAANLKY